MRDRSNEGKLIGCILYPDSPKGEFNSAQELDSIWNFYSSTCKIAYILHDKDTRNNGSEAVKAHYHLIISSRSTLSRPTFQERWKISGHCCMILDNWEASVQYLVHQNPNYDESDGGHIYDPIEIHSNFILDKYFRSLSSTDPEWKQALQIINWAIKNKANYYQILRYAGEHGLYYAYCKTYHQIHDILGDKPWVLESEILDSEDVGKEYIKF